VEPDDTMFVDLTIWLIARVITLIDKLCHLQTAVIINKRYNTVLVFLADCLAADPGCIISNCCKGFQCYSNDYIAVNRLCLCLSKCQMYNATLCTYARPA